MSRVSAPWLALFAVVAVVHLALLGLQVSPADSITKCLAAPVLIGWVLSTGAPRILAVALACCLGGDLFLEIEGLFVLGMASFALAHVAFIVWFVSCGALARLRSRPLLPVGLALAAVVLVAIVWGGIDDPVVRGAIPFYALLLSGTAATALAVDARAGLGALCFLVSDAVIALTVADRLEAGTPTDLVIMVLYLSAIALLVTGAARLTPSGPRRSGTRAPEPRASGPRAPGRP